MRALRKSTGPGQLTLDFEPTLPEQFNTLREFVAFRVQAAGRPQKTVAADMDMGPSTLSRKLAPGAGDTHRFNVDDLELYMQVTGDVEPIAYLIAKYMQTAESRTARLSKQAEELMQRLSVILPQLESAE